MDSVYGLLILLSFQLMLLTTADNQDDILIAFGGMFGPAKVELVSAAADQPVSCEQTIPAPEALAFGSYDINFRPDRLLVYCIGVMSRSCYSTSPGASSWKRYARLITPRSGSARMQFHDYILFTGGSTSGRAQNSSELWHPVRQEFVHGPQLPYRASSHCIVTINETHALLTGGQLDEQPLNHAFMFNRNTEEWTRMSSMKENRAGHSCGLVDGSKVVVAGGITGGDEELPTSTADIYDLQTQTWAAGPDLPVPLEKAASVQLDSTFLIVGGVTDAEALDTLYEYDVENNDWMLRRETLNLDNSPRPAVWKVPASYLNCSNGELG